MIGDVRLAADVRQGGPHVGLVSVCRHLSRGRCEGAVGPGRDDHGEWVGDEDLARPGPATQRDGFVDGALRDHVVGIQSIPSAADLEPRQLLRYASGHASDDERTALEDFVKRSRWASGRFRGSRVDAAASTRSAS